MEIIPHLVKSIESSKTFLFILLFSCVQMDKKTRTLEEATEAFERSEQFGMFKTNIILIITTTVFSGRSMMESSLGRRTKWGGCPMCPMSPRGRGGGPSSPSRGWNCCRVWSYSSSLTSWSSISSSSLSGRSQQALSSTGQPLPAPLLRRKSSPESVGLRSSSKIWFKHQCS